jgi:hypothetical protein
MDEREPQPQGGRGRIPPRPPTGVATLDYPSAGPPPRRLSWWQYLLALIARLLYWKR